MKPVSLTRRLTIVLGALYILPLMAAGSQWIFGTRASYCFALACFPLIALPVIARLVLRPLRVAATLANDGCESLNGKIPAEIAPLMNALIVERDRVLSIRTREQGYFTDVAHEFRTCLAILQARVDLTLKGEENTEFSRDIARLTRFISQLLVKSKMRIRDLAFTPVDLNVIMRAVVSEMAPLAVREGCEIQFDGPGEPVTIAANSAVLEDGLRNLILNAIQHTRQGTPVAVSLSREGGVVVRDHGPGIPDLYKDQIFQPFWKHRDQGRNGAGLGLMLVRETALLHNGTISFANHPDGGAVFSLNLPLSSAQGTLYPYPVDREKHGTKHVASDLSFIVDFSDDVIFDTDKAGNITSWNRAAERILGYSAGEIIGTHAVTLMPSDRVHDGDLIRERIQHGLNVEKYSTAFRHKNSTIVPICLSISPKYDAGGVVSGSTSIARDLSENKNSQSALQEKLHLLSTITDNASEAMLMSDPQNGITFMNAAAEKLCGWSFAELKGKCLHDTLHHKHADGSHFPQEECPLLTVYSTGRAIQNFDDFMVHRDGGLIDVSYSTAPIIVGGVVTGSVLVVRDIRERRKAEAILQHAEKMRAIGNLTGGMAHDFNNVLAIVIANLDELLQARAKDADVMDLAGSALEAAISGSELTRRLLAFARRQSLRPVVIDVNDLVRTTARLLARMLGQGIEMELSLATDLWAIAADPVQLQSCLTNLAANARDAMPRGGRLTIASRNEVLDKESAAQHFEAEPGEYVIIEVRDSGTGMSPETISRIFEPFFSTKSELNGTGLGLSMAFGFMKQSGGHIAVSSTPGAGSSFTLFFPRSAAAPLTRSMPEPAITVNGRGRTVLAVEDNSALRRILVRHLKSLGYTVFAAGDATGALAVLDAVRIDVLFTDVVMPGLSGFDLADIVRQRWPHTRIVMTSGFPELSAEQTAKPFGETQLLAKPFRKEELSRILAEAM